MAASSDRNPPPFPSAEEPEAGPPDMADGDSDEGEDIFVNNVCGRLGRVGRDLCVLFVCAVRGAGQSRAVSPFICSDLAAE